jgi:hypothetical protein
VLQNLPRLCPYKRQNTAKGRKLKLALHTAQAEARATHGASGSSRYTRRKRKLALHTAQAEARATLDVSRKLKLALQRRKLKLALQRRKLKLALHSVNFFCKFKSKIKANNKTGLTESVFTITNFSQPFSENETQNALEKVKLKVKCTKFITASFFARSFQPPEIFHKQTIIRSRQVFENILYIL